MDVGKSLIGLAVGIGGGAVAGLAGYGLYGVFRERGMTPLKAGAATGWASRTMPYCASGSWTIFTRTRFIQSCRCSSRFASCERS